MDNYAGRDDVDDKIEQELITAGITVLKMPKYFRNNSVEMKTLIRGCLDNWSFTRAWSYWVAEGPGIPPEYTRSLHLKFGKEVRVDGDCTCPDPDTYHKGFATGLYHVDTQEGLNALADTLRQILQDWETSHGNV